jgi:hypothetical protein
MLKVLIFLDCDECGNSVKTASVCSVADRQVWDQEISVLMQRAEVQGWRFFHIWEQEIGLLMSQAENQGWRFFREYGICPDCIQMELAMADWYEEEYPQERY